MPIRFRCPACGKLLGIARRKAGTVVSCPQCKVNVTVPKGSLTEEKTVPVGAIAPVPVSANGSKPKAETPLFERTDFEALLDPAAKAAARAVLAPPPQMPVAVQQVPQAIAVDEADVVLLPKTNLTLIAVVMVVLIGLAFAAGYLLAAVTLPAAKAG